MPAPDQLFQKAAPDHAAGAIQDYLHLVVPPQQWMAGTQERFDKRPGEIPPRQAFCR
jgi:hypothetical protein